MAYPKAFMETLGQYVYAYYPEGLDTQPEYVGKGVDTRCLSHVKDKDQDPANLYIMGRNLEKYAKSTPSEDIASFAAEAAIIAITNPKLNSVSGRYGKLWNPTRLDDLYTEWKKEQINPVKESMRFYNDHPEIQDHVKGMWVTGKTFVFTQSTVDGIEYLLYVTPEVDTFIPLVKVKFSAKNRDELRDQWVQDNEKDYELTADGEMINVNGLSVEQAIELWLS